MAYQYKRRKPSLILNFWIYRRVILTAILLGVILWFIWANDARVTVAFPFGMGQLSSTLGIVMLLSALVGALATLLVSTIIIAFKRLRGSHSPDESPAKEPPDDRPPPDYAAKTTEGFSNSRWSN
jgi:uncharacterized integral membrane protein